MKYTNLLEATKRIERLTDDKLLSFSIHNNYPQQLSFTSQEYWCRIVGTEAPLLVNDKNAIFDMCEKNSYWEVRFKRDVLGKHQTIYAATLYGLLVGLEKFLQGEQLVQLNPDTVRKMALGEITREDTL